ncbi:uncharacterized protein LOC135845285 [Planococcus citri]|uniref:uncharacterized protein LOC135845285 n=1 Tax=Planococcus citri TaxID=170843 RepID=UPI0031F8AAD1
MLTSLSNNRNKLRRNRLKMSELPDEPEFDRPHAVQKFVDYLNENHPVIKRSLVNELNVLRQFSADTLRARGIPQPQPINESDTENENDNSTDVGGLQNTATISGHQRNLFVNRLRSWLLYLMSPHSVGQQTLYAYPHPGAARVALITYFRAFGIPDEVFTQWFCPMVFNQPVQQH